MRVGSTSFARFYTVHERKIGERLVSGAIRPTGSLKARNQTSQRSVVVPVDIAHKSSFVRYKDPQSLLIDVYV